VIVGKTGVSEPLDDNAMGFGNVAREKMNTPRLSLNVWVFHGESPGDPTDQKYPGGQSQRHMAA
jgi:hypothetical protein